MERRGFSPNGESPQPRPENRVRGEHQLVQGRWQELIHNGGADVMGRVNQLKQEFGEVMEEVNGNPPDTLDNLPKAKRDALGGEVVDTIIASLGLLDSLHLDFETMFYKKVGIMYEKYNPGEVNDLIAKGMTHKEAMAHLKARWNAQQKKNGS